MRIAIDVRSLMEGRLSGVQEYTTQIIRALLQAGPQHEYHVFYNSLRPVRLPDFGGPVRVHWYRWPNKAFNAVQLMTGRPRWDTLVPADVFFVPHARLTPLADATPLVVTAHDLSYERFPEFYSQQRRLWHHLVQARLTIETADHVIAVSQATADDVATLYDVDRCDVSVVYSGVEQAEGVTEGTAVSLPAKYVLFLGTLEPRKNIVSVVEAFSAIANRVPHDLVIAGSAGWLTGEIDRAIERSRQRARLHRIGFVPEGAKHALFAGADLFVYPSFYEGFGFPPLEALLAGTPVVTSMNSSLPEVVGRWATLIDPHNVSELALVMEELLLNAPPVPASAGAEIRELYSWDRAARETLDILENVS